jgi:CubicO group peptidase (beta-lactamase class C family)
MTPPHQIWSFRHVREIIPTERVRKAALARELPPEPRPDILDLTFEAHDGPIVLGDFLRHRERDALVVLHNGNLAAEWLAEGMRDDEPHLIFSVTKSITGLLANALASKGLLDLDKTVADYVPEAAAGGFGNATLHQMLDMEASYAFVEDYSPGPDVTAYRHAAGWYPAPDGAPALEEFLLTRQAEGEHGQKFRYLSPTTDMVGVICARVSGMTWAQAVSTYLWQPAGAEEHAEVTVDREGTPRAAGGFCTVPRDLARLGQLVADGGLGAVSPEYLDDIMHGGDPDHWAIGDFADFFPGGAYRSFWYKPRVDPDVLLGVGIHGQLLYVDVARNVVVVILSSWSEPDNEVRHTDNYIAARTIARSYDTWTP